MDATDIYCVNQSCIKLTDNLVIHDKSKNIEIKYYYIQDMVHRRDINLQYVPTQEQVAYFLTKPLFRVKFAYFRDKISVVGKGKIGKRDL